MTDMIKFQITLGIVDTVNDPILPAHSQGTVALEITGQFGSGCRLFEQQIDI